MDKFPEYLRETVDWFIGKTRGRRPDGRSAVTPDGCSSDHSKLYLQKAVLDSSVPLDDLRELSDLPEDLDAFEWIAWHSIGFFEHINLICGTVSEFCTVSACPDMTGPGPRHYTWADDKGRKIRLPAPQYIDCVMTFMQKTIYDESIFPTKHGVEFSPTFDAVAKRMYRMLLTVLGHIYHAHFNEIVIIQLHRELNTVFSHFVEFGHRFNLLDATDFEPMDDLIRALRLSAASSTLSTAVDSEDECSTEVDMVVGENAIESSCQSPMDNQSRSGDEMSRL